MEVPEVKEFETATSRGDLQLATDVSCHWLQKPEVARINWKSSQAFAQSAFDHRKVIIALLESGVKARHRHFYDAMKIGNFGFLQLYRDHGVKFNTPRDNWNPPLLAETFADPEMMQWFLDHGADPNGASEWNKTALSRAMLIAPLKIIIKLLDKRGVNSIKHGEPPKWAVLREYSDHISVMAFLLSRGAACDVNRVELQHRWDIHADRNGVTGCQAPIHQAADWAD